MQELQKLIHSTPIGSLPRVPDVVNEIALDSESELFISEKRKEISQILNGEDNRLLVIIGPCSIHDPEAGLEYARKLADLQGKYSDQLLIVMRTYFEKPRTRVGWKGLIVDPDLDDSHNMRKGLFVARKFLKDVIDLKLATSTEFLDTTIYPYISDLICWGAIGARTTESQTHRQMASALPCPIGFKNGTDGNINIAIDAIHAAKSSHLICVSGFGEAPIAAITKGNPAGHVILRGGKKPNYSNEHVCEVTKQLESSGLTPNLIVDCSHGNSLKVAKNQLNVARDIAQQIIDGEQYIAGVMSESFLVGGAQSIGNFPLTKGQSITDECLSWEDTVAILDIFANAKAEADRKQFSTVA
ncbi:3-deoxy-7-phosphoheptulonate synthase [Vibrio sp. vnigr-6D03]|uniref:3-deoxy-7-phosphoheptulonate synthase n=1 Tax=Vibrio sp. vnigr-6D03 TaxID=2058088 RepID=UPI000C32E96E|nr:3-deoxy-7-phosphoheptulonate synthase [Vibrio sp. vnigr-6D03]PKF81162.1 3-deoxy-7-phosphoheptulonate synthase [Vibrio sp. vnigr-6D03]